MLSFEDLEITSDLFMMELLHCSRKNTCSSTSVPARALGWRHLPTPHVWRSVCSQQNPHSGTSPAPPKRQTLSVVLL